MSLINANLPAALDRVTSASHYLTVLTGLIDPNGETAGELIVSVASR